MLKISYWVDTYKTTLRAKKPRGYMTSWDFDRLLKYIKSELEYREIDLNTVSCITLEGENRQKSILRK